MPKTDIQKLCPCLKCESSNDGGCCVAWPVCDGLMDWNKNRKVADENRHTDNS